jgi:hypothetical protein
MTRIRIHYQQSLVGFFEPKLLRSKRQQKPRRYVHGAAADEDRPRRARAQLDPNDIVRTQSDVVVVHLPEKGSADEV